jgi:prepilin-type N-terminal cleavage/methylation domain-containing protein
MQAKKKNSGFTIVELLIVIVVIGILAAITIVAYNGIQLRARDSRRLSDMKSIEQALTLYSLDNNGGYPGCNNVTYVPGGALQGCALSAISPSLVPKYMSTFPVDPINTGNDIFQYAVGFRKTSDTTYTGDQSNNYITGMHLETQVGNINTGWVSPNYYNYLGGSSNQ